MATQPSRGERADYDTYLERMDASMRQKVALTAAYLLCEGRVADMGMGSGAGSHALAALYPNMRVVGVDLDPEMVSFAREKYRLENLEFVVGDIAERVFAAGELDGIFNSSVLHHVTTFSGYDYGAAERALQVQTEELNDTGVLIVRDFVDPGQGVVELDLPADDGDASDEPESCSTASLFERFATEFRPLSGSPGLPLHRVRESFGPPLAPGWRRYRTTAKLAAEFVLRKDYRDSWSAEIKEEYTYFTHAGFEEVFGRLGLRVLVSAPIWNPWIVENRFRGKFALWSPDGEALDPPPTNFIIAGQKVGEGEGVRFEEVGPAPSVGHLQLHYYRDRETGAQRELVSRPDPTVEVIPNFEEGDATYVLARMSYPRPILSCANRGTTHVDSVRAVSYVTEPLNAPLRQTSLSDAILEVLEERAGIGADQVGAMTSGSVYYPSPGGVQEEVHSCFVDIAPIFVRRRFAFDTGFSTAGLVRAIEARQLLRAAQVGGLLDARLELNVYDLLLDRNKTIGAWIGAAMAPVDGPGGARATGFANLSVTADEARYIKVLEPPPSPFLELRTSLFREYDASGQAGGERTLEYVTPTCFSFGTASVALVRRVEGVWCLGVDRDHLPAAQILGAGSGILVNPAWRLPRHLGQWSDAVRWVKERVASEYGVECGRHWPLGTRYHPSAGLTPEYVVPMAFEVRAESVAARTLSWVGLDELVHHRDQLRDGHLRVASIRAAHALGLLTQIP